MDLSSHEKEDRRYLPKIGQRRSRHMKLSTAFGSSTGSIDSQIDENTWKPKNHYLSKEISQDRAKMFIQHQTINVDNTAVRSPAAAVDLNEIDNALLSSRRVLPIDLHESASKRNSASLGLRKRTIQPEKITVLVDSKVKIR